MKELKLRIKRSGLKQKFIANSVGISESHLTMMLNKGATMSDRVRNEIITILEKYKIV